jgi:hypothetical protein
MSRVVKIAIASLACLMLLGASTVIDSATADWKQAPVVPKISDASRAKLLKTLRRGARLGNRGNVFAKIGDSLSESAAFMQGLGCQRWSPGPFEGLRLPVRYFSGRRLPGTSTLCPVVNSFSRNSAATKGGETSEWPLHPGASADPSCASDETPLACEVRLTRPAYAVILFGVNDIAFGKALGFDPLSYFLPNMDRIIQSARALGVVPIVSTLPPRTFDPGDEAAAEQLNAGLYRLAVARRVPVVNLWRALIRLPDWGSAADRIHLSVFGGPECVHICDPSTCAPACQPANFTRAGLGYGYNVRNLTTAVLLKRLFEISRARRQGKR